MQLVDHRKLTDAELLKQKLLDHKKPPDSAGKVSFHGKSVRRKSSIVEIRNGFWDEMPGRTPSYFHRTNVGTYNNGGPQITYNIGAAINVPANTVLDITSIRFEIMLASANPGVFNQAPHGFGYQSLRFRLAINGRNVFDQLVVDANVPTRDWGFNILNRNVFESALGVKLHGVVEENSIIQPQMFVRAANGPVAVAGTLMAATIEGRWLSQPYWNELKERLA